MNTVELAKEFTKDGYIDITLRIAEGDKQGEYGVLPLIIAGENEVLYRGKYHADVDDAIEAVNRFLAVRALLRRTENL